MSRGVAITREVSPAFEACELTHLARVPIDVALARAQHAAYEQALSDAGYAVEHLDADAGMPDSVFVEDMAVVFDEVAIITRPGAESRRIETPLVAAALSPYRPLHAIAAPGIVDGGDVLVAGHQVFVGRSSRTNAAAIDQMRGFLAPHGYTVCEVVVAGCLHLKSAVTVIDAGVLLMNPAWIDTRAFGGFDVVEVDPDEPTAANALRLGDRLIVSSSFPRTTERLAQRSLRLQMVDASELAKAEGAVTCCSLIVHHDQRRNR